MVYTEEIRIRKAGGIHRGEPDLQGCYFHCVAGGLHTGDPDPLDRNFSYYCVADGDPDCVAGDVHTHTGN